MVTKVSFFRIPTRAMTSMATITIRLHGTMPATRISTSCVTCLTPTCFFLCCCPRTWWSQPTWGHWAGDRLGAALCLLVGSGADHQEPAPHRLPGSQAQWVWPLPVGCHSAGQLQWMLGQHCSCLQHCWNISWSAQPAVSRSQCILSDHSVSTQAFLTLSLTSQRQWRRPM